MAAKKRKAPKRKAAPRAKAKKRNPVNPVNPAKRRKASTRRTYSKARRTTSRRTGRKRYARRRSYLGNPVGVLGQAFTLAGAGAAIGLLQPFIGRFVTPYIGVSPLSTAGLAFGTGWILSMAAGLTSFTRRFKNDILLAGGVVAAAQLISAYVVPALRLRMAPPPAQNGNGMGRRFYNGMGGIAAIPGTFPGPMLNMGPVPTGAPGQGMQGMAAWRPVGS